MSDNTRIVRIKIESFGCFGREIDIELTRPGPNFISGPNTSGKSTLIRAVRAVIYGMDAGDIRIYKPWNSRNAFSGELHFISSGKNEKAYVVKRDFDTNKVMLSRSSAEGEIVLFNETANPAARGSNQNLAEYFSLLKAELGIPNEGLFLSTVCVDQLKMETAIDAELRHLLTGSASGDYNAIINKLESEYFELTKQHYNEGGSRKSKDRRIEVLKGTLADKKLKLDELKGTLNNLSEKREQHDKLTGRIKELQVDKEKKEKQYRELDECFNLNKEIEKLREESKTFTDSLKAIEKNAGKIQETEDNIKKIGFQSELLQDFSEKLIQLKSATVDIEDDELRLSQLGKNRSKVANKLILVVGGAIFTLALIFSLIISNYFPAIAGLIILLAAVIYWFKKTSADAELYARRSILEHALDIKREELQQLYSELQPCTGWGRLESLDFEKEHQRYQKYMKFRGDLRVLEGVRKTFSDSERIIKERKKVESDLGINQRRLEEILQENTACKLFLDDPDRVAVLQNRREEVKAIISEHKEAVLANQKLDGEISALSTMHIDSSETLTEDIERTEQDLLNCEAQAAALKVALIVMQESVSEFHSVYKDRLAGEIGQRFSGFTKGRYDKLALDDDFILKAALPEQEDIDAGQLSTGTRDQLFFAVRLALSSELAGDMRAPFIFDDPFVNFDDERLKCVVELLKEISVKQQVIILSHDQRLEQLIPCAVRLKSTV